MQHTDAYKFTLALPTHAHRLTYLHTPSHTHTYTQTRDRRRRRPLSSRYYYYFVNDTRITPARYAHTIVNNTPCVNTCLLLLCVMLCRSKTPPTTRTRLRYGYLMVHLFVGDGPAEDAPTTIAVRTRAAPTHSPRGAIIRFFFRGLLSPAPVS